MRPLLTAGCSSRCGLPGSAQVSLRAPAPSCVTPCLCPACRQPRQRTRLGSACEVSRPPQALLPQGAAPATGTTAIGPCRAFHLMAVSWQLAGLPDSPSGQASLPIAGRLMPAVAVWFCLRQHGFAPGTDRCLSPYWRTGQLGSMWLGRGGGGGCVALMLAAACLQGCWATSAYLKLRARGRAVTAAPRLHVVTVSTLEQVRPFASCADGCKTRSDNFWGCSKEGSRYRG